MPWNESTSSIPRGSSTHVPLLFSLYLSSALPVKHVSTSSWPITTMRFSTWMLSQYIEYIASFQCRREITEISYFFGIVDLDHNHSPPTKCRVDKYKTPTHTFFARHAEKHRTISPRCHEANAKSPICCPLNISMCYYYLWVWSGSDTWAARILPSSLTKQLSIKSQYGQSTIFAE